MLRLVWSDSLISHSMAAEPSVMYMLCDSTAITSVIFMDSETEDNTGAVLLAY